METALGNRCPAIWDIFESRDEMHRNQKNPLASVPNKAMACHQTRLYRLRQTDPQKAVLRYLPELRSASIRNLPVAAH